MHDPNDKPPGFMATTRAGLNLLVLAAQCVARPLQLLTTRPGTAGRRYFGSLQCGLGLLAFPFVLAFLAPSLGEQAAGGMGGVFLFWLLLLAAALVHGVRGAALRKRGYWTHSMFWGKPLLPPLFSAPSPRHKFRNDAGLALGWCVLGGLVTGSAPLVVWGLVGAAAVGVSTMYAEADDAARIEAAEDAEWDAVSMNHRLEERRRNRWN